MDSVSRETLHLKMEYSYQEFLEKEFPRLSTSQFAQFEKYVDLVQTFNKRMNLISRFDTERIWQNHIIPSIVIDRLIQLPAKTRLLDLGSGAGLPGIPLKILHPEFSVVLADSTHKKIMFLKNAIRDLQLTGVTAIRTRIGKDDDIFYLSGKFDIVTIRAVSDIEKIYRIAVPLLSSSGYILLWKGLTDIDNLKPASRKSNFRYEIIKIPSIFKQYSKNLESKVFFRIWPK